MNNFEERLQRDEIFTYTDFYGDIHALGDYECRHEFIPIGVNNLRNWVKCNICGDIRQRNEVKE